MLMTKTDALDNALQTGLLAIDALELTPMRPLIEHIRLHLTAIERQRGVSSSRKLAWKVVEVYKALTGCRTALTIPGVNIAIRASDLMLTQIKQHPKQGSRKTALETFEYWQKLFNYQKHVRQ